MRLLLIGFVLLAGCQLGPRYEVPVSPIAQEWKGTSEPLPAPEVANWWDVFGDESLKELEKRVVANNPNLYAALQRVMEARAVAGVAKSELFPQAGLKPSYNDTGELIELYGVPPGLFPGLKTIVRVHEMSYELPLNMSYEVDIWQKNYGKFRAAKLYIEAEEDAFRSSMLTLTSDLASNYFNAHILDAQIDLLRQSVEALREMARLRQIRFQVGLDPYTDVLAVEQVLADAQSKYVDLERQRALFENAVAVLVGVSASEFTLPHRMLKEDPPLVPAGLPSTLLVRRPDVAQAERTMASYHALIGVAYASFFPSLNLTGALGFLSPELSKFLTWQGNLWDWGFQIFQTVFDGFRRSSTLDLAYAKYRETEGQYKNSVLTAFAEVEDALNNLESQAKESELLSRAETAASQNWQLYQSRFIAGLSNQLEVLQYKLNDLEAEMNLANNLGLRYQATLQLIKAIGGAWDDSLELAAEEQGCGAEGEDGDEDHGPNIVQNVVQGQILEETPPRNDEKVAQGDHVGDLLEPDRHIIDRGREAGEECGRGEDGEHG